MNEVALQPGAGRARAAALRLLGDDRLCKRARTGDGEAFAAIAERYQQPLYRYCRGLLGDAEDARDAVQNALLSAWQALRGEQRELALKPWLYRIAHNESVTLLRRRRPHAGLDVAEALPSDGFGADAETRERLAQLVSDMRELPEGQRGALLMRELSGLGYEEIGAALGSSPAAAKQAVYDARRSLEDFAKGRAMSCDEVTRAISGGDGRMLRGRRVRAHLRGCDSCRDFRTAISTRRRDLGMIAPPLPAAAAAALLEGVLGGGGGGAAGGGGIGAASAIGKLVGGSVAAKSVAAGAAALVIGAGAAGVVNVAVEPGAGARPDGSAQRSADLARVDAGAERAEVRRLRAERRRETAASEGRRGRDAGRGRAYRGRRGARAQDGRPDGLPGRPDGVGAPGRPRVPAGLPPSAQTGTPPPAQAAPPPPAQVAPAPAPVDTGGSQPAVSAPEVAVPELESAPPASAPTAPVTGLGE